MQRDLYHSLLEWKKAKSRKPLVVCGARQVGKTWLLKTFGKKEYAHSIYLNFEENPRLGEFFQEKKDPQTILSDLELYLNTKINPNKTLIIFDDIQEALSDLNNLAYFLESAHQLHIAAASSLLGMKLRSQHGFLAEKIDFLDLYPLTFLEFLSALSKDKLRNDLLSIKTSKTYENIPTSIHNDLISLFKTYMIVGGMPEAVQEYTRTKDFVAVRKTQQDILDTYLLDFAKHAPKDIVMKITNVWNSISIQLAKENKKFKWSDIQQNARAREYKSALEWLVDAGLIYRSYPISYESTVEWQLENGVVYPSHPISTVKFPLSADSEKNTFKIFLLDTGLLTALSRVAPNIILEGDALFFECKGAFTENLIAQALTTQHLPLHYWRSAGTAEVDFIIEHENNIYPLEVKSDRSTKKKSLLVYEETFKPSLILRASFMNLKKNGNLLNIPFYLMQGLKSFIAQKQ